MLACCAAHAGATKDRVQLPQLAIDHILPHGQGYGLTETCAASFIGIPDQIVRR